MFYWIFALLAAGIGSNVDQPFVNLWIDPEALARMLSKYGPWGVCVILFILLVFLYISTSKKIEKIRKEEKKDSFLQRRELLKALGVKQEQFMALIEKLTSRIDKDE